ncbi:hypothetical protein EPUS_05119 [Endocarpon pusillum Z07020]|uniref:Heterokaryon incompatibility domain-containing protein n=1 Tax=Endocarpon pusillum (strain Z07020 / HMAS-L-300199) TaxID=1263415 RepID=U1G0M8_ENDPU|nr:uncharacterized protein EPUS_05119 [Endocarpon pusillum Z07020]ERF70767.1 hypothetical protein EPUS_05119 [Endocarpon pusillum Z07020]
MPGIIYQPLNHKRREIRLLILKSSVTDQPGESSNDRDQPIQYSFHITSLALYSNKFESDIFNNSGIGTAAWGLNELQKFVRRAAGQKPAGYTALSYVWGDPACVCDVEIDGQQVKIPRNLFEALTSVRVNTSSRVLWADALCINQEDDVEKSWQVQEMATIYRRAQSVISWLGGATGQTRVAYSVFRDLQGKEDWSNMSFLNAFQSRATSGAAFEEEVARLVDDPERWTAMLAILDRPYWTRMWIFPELACARNRFFLCGDELLKDIDRTVQRLIASPHLVGKAALDLMAEERSSMILAARGLTFRSPEGLAIDERKARRPLLVRLLRNLSTLVASDERDLIYALLSIADDRVVLEIIPDYSKTVVDVFTQAAMALLKQNHLEVFLDAVSSEASQRLGLPSWAPDWPEWRDLKLNHDLYRVCDYKFKQRSTNLHFNTRHVTLDCYIVDEIMLTGEPYRTKPPIASATMRGFKLCEWLESIESAIWDHSRYIKTQGESSTGRKQDITLRLLSADALFEPPARRIPRNLPPESISDIYHKLRTADSLTALRDYMGQASVQKTFTNVGSYFSAVRHTLLRNNGARPFRTVGGYSCLSVEGECKFGDSVVIVPGLDIPLILRKTEPGHVSESPYSLVGVAYVHGIMDGEYFSQRTPRPERQRVTLC